ncbi:CaiB/BaiF CoA transferase family protein [Polyangium aurulentum]|uniref:CaiB/BaiF CoA transferase family protein n=1 Tax=Polyangium aurulentum TaxID=2567896 RepID=UPI0010ADCB66|nr:CaiB/BaiF CoA-transferase family protein [Polyangium aurulentum]UQA54971.1 CoA transferase [Polyangium aurulentum]
MRPLVGTRILDLSRLLPGPFATLVLADLGANVDKIEDLGGGDYMRHMPPHIAGESAAFQLLNRGKRSALLDLKRPEGRAAFERLVASYDVLFDQFRPGVLARLGLGHDALRAINPKLIICALTGYGQTGPLAQRAGHDIDYLARGGLLGVQGPEDGAPQPPGFQLADVSGGMWCVIAILAALAERQRTGEGRVLDISMTDGVLGFASVTLGAMLAGEVKPRGADVLTGGIAPYNTYLSKDGHPLALGALEPKFWMAFCAAAGITPRMEALLPGPHQAEIKAELRSVFASKTREEWIALAAVHDCCLEPAVAPEDLRDDPLVRARELFFELETSRGRIPQLRTPVTPKGTDFTPPPRAGEHTRAVLRDGGFSDAEIDDLVKAGAIREA